MTRKLQFPGPAAIPLVALGWLLASAAPLPGAGALQAPGPDAAVATVGGQSITVAALELHMQRRAGDSGQPATPEHRKTLLEEILRVEALSERARRAGYDKDPEIVAQVRRLMARKLRQEELDPKLDALAVAEAELRRHYEQNPKEHALPRQARAALIFVKVPAQADAARKAELEKRAAEALSAARKLPADSVGFGAVAVQYSEDQATRYQRGEIGWVAEGREDYRWPSALSKAALALQKPGEIGPLVRTDEGLYLVRLIERKEAGRRSFDEVRPAIERSLLMQKRKALVDEYYEAAKREVGVEVHEAVLEAMPAPQGVRDPKTARRPLSVPGG
jgi:peptidyl-prolyl cis-trans isomerase C